MSWLHGLGHYDAPRCKGVAPRSGEGHHMQVSKLPRFVRLSYLIGKKDATPPIPPIVPLSAATIWRMVKEGTFPAPKKLGKNSTAWILAEVEEWARMRSGLGGSGGVER